MTVERRSFPVLTGALSQVLRRHDRCQAEPAQKGGRVSSGLCTGQFTGKAAQGAEFGVSVCQRRGPGPRLGRLSPHRGSLAARGPPASLTCCFRNKTERGDVAQALVVTPAWPVRSHLSPPYFLNLFQKQTQERTWSQQACLDRTEDGGEVVSAGPSAHGGAAGSDAALGPALVAGALHPGVARARGEVTGPALFGALVFRVPVEQTCEEADACKDGKNTRQMRGWLPDDVRTFWKAGQAAPCKAPQRSSPLSTLPRLTSVDAHEKASEKLPPPEVDARCLRSMPVEAKPKLTMNSRALRGFLLPREL